MKTELKAPEEMAEVFDDIRRNIDASEITRMKEGLWQITIRKLCEKYGIGDDAIFAEVEEAVRANWAAIEAVPGAAAIMQDALVEFRTNARELLR
jgi:hypothetical protein